jgi:O-antigen/teichoic acid export membrane protein
VQNIGFMALQQAPGWLVTMTLGAGALGHFSRGLALAQMPATALTAVQSRIAQPHWRHMADRRSFQEAVCDASLLSAGVAFPAFAILSVNGSVIINLWLGPGWELAGSMVATFALGFGLSIPFTLMAGSFEMKGDFKPARAAQWCMTGAMLPPMVAMIMTHDVLWASYTTAISQAAGLVCLVAVVNWHSASLRKRVIYGFLQQLAWAAVIAIGGLFAADFASSTVFGSGDLLQFAVGAGASGLIWVCTFRWHATSLMLARRGLRLPRLLRAASV